MGRTALDYSGWHNAAMATTTGLHRVELTVDDGNRLQRFFEENPEYFLAVNGTPPPPGIGREEIEELPPPGMPYSRKYSLGFEDGSGDLRAIAMVVSDLLAPRVWHIGLLIVATRLRGTGLAQSLLAELEAWMRGEGAEWIRLGVVIGNARAERFWKRAGYVETRVRHGVDTGGRLNDIRAMVKPLCDGTIDQYLSLVARDRPESE